MEVLHTEVDVPNQCDQDIFEIAVLVAVLLKHLELRENINYTK